ncbi:MAG TPA: hypothetical protein VMJ13_03030 [Candidatus Acidoferrum sp.]|nr:hypothetical protein [Candidatus Acidoferrum sp.]
MAKLPPRSPSNLTKSDRTDLGEYLLLAALIALIIGAVLLHVAHIRLP